MTVSPEPPAARVFLIGRDEMITRTLSRLLQLDESIQVSGAAPSVGTASVAAMGAGVVILDEEDQPVETARARAYLEGAAPHASLALLDEMRDFTVGELLAAVRRLAPGERFQTQRHLQAVDVATNRDALGALSEREIQVVRLVAEGLSNKEISARLDLSDKTVKNHISHILAKMNLTARTQVAVYAIRAGLV